MNSRREYIQGFGAFFALALAPQIALASSAPAKGKAPESNFVAISQVTATIMSGHRGVGIMQIDVGIYTTDNALKSRLSALNPVLKARWRASLQEFINRFYTPGSVPDANILARMLQTSVDPILAPSTGRVLLQSVIAR